MKKTCWIWAAGLFMASGFSGAAPGVPVDGSRAWLNRPWEIRYILFVDSAHGLEIRTRLARRNNAAQEALKEDHVYLDGDELFEPTEIFAIRGTGLLDEKVALISIPFERSGRIISSSERLRMFTAKRNMLDDLVLVKGTSQAEKPYYFAEWSQGIPGAEHFSPAVCTYYDRDRYEDGWRSDSSSGSFGCREWTAQLYSSEQPYIDVTSYSKRGNFIGEFVGWSRFSDPPKPVIGAQGKTWLCLHECPAGEKPGVIADIKAWTRKHGFPMPERPPKQPLYPNSDYKDDIEEE